MVHWKIAIYAGIGAFSLSFLLGIISGNPFFMILLRALIFAAIFIGIGAAGSFVINKYIPGLLEGNYTPAKESPDGENINIVIPEENMTETFLEKKETVNEDFREEVELTEELEMAEESENNDQLNAGREITNEGAMVEPEEKAGEDLDDVDTEEVYPEAGGEVLETDKNDQEAEINEAPAEQNMDNQTTEKKQAEEEIDELPDMGVLENSFLVLNNTGGSEEIPLSGVSSRIKDKLPKEKDPEVYAKALRTIIKRDEEGPKKYGR